MKLIRLLPLFAGLFLFFSCDELDINTPGAGFGGTKNVEIHDFQFGYMTHQSKLEKILHLNEPQFRTFVSSESFQQAFEKGLMDSTQYSAGKFEFSKVSQTLTVKCIPEKAAIKNVTCTSSDTTVVKVLGVSFDGIQVQTLKLGPVDLTVTVEGAKNTFVHTYPLRVVGTIDLKMYITPFWLHFINTRIRYKTKGLPEGNKELLMWVSDSVAVIGECEWYDHYKYGSRVQVTRDTITFPLRKHYDRFKKGHRVLLRNITSAVKQFCNDTIMGTRVRYIDSLGVYDTIPAGYAFKPEQVILNFNCYAENPYFEFYITQNCDRTTDSATGSDTGSDADVIDKDDENESDESDRTTLQYFVVQVNDFLTQAQRDSISREIQKVREETGFKDEYSDEQKDAILKKINDEKDK